ncbi:MAG TPA: glycoside hydrolase family 2 TIM barrel-domain containing protein [Candidatus Lokiarchaeia archaeon]|nr:glycoside hydrolase family 2 TIM barrel-domain containing protein [Candidatus Lokiarchaeia archaeon]
MAVPVSKPGIRLKIEFLPLLMNLPFVAIFLYVLYSNTDYWSMGNAYISGALHVNLDWVSLILYFVYGIGAYSVIVGIAGLVNYRILHLRQLNIFPPIFLVILIAFLLVLVNLNVRINLDYLFFMLGGVNGFIVYMGVSAGIFILTILVIAGIKQLLENKPTFEWGFSGKSRLALHPRLVAATTIVSMIAGSAVFLALGFYYPKTEVYWMDVIGIHTRYVDTASPAFITWVIMVIVTAGLGIIALVQPKLRKNARARLSWIGRKEPVLALVAGNVIVVAWFVISFELSMPAELSGIWAFPALTISAVSCGAFIPLIIAWKTWLAGKPSRSKVLQRLARFSGIFKIVAVIALIFIPFWIVYYQPLFVGIPNIDLPFQAKLVNMNGVDVPVESGIVYPSFEAQNRVVLNLSTPWRFWRGNNQSSIYSLAPRTDEYIAKLSEGEQEPTFDDSNWSVVRVPSPVSQYEDTGHYFGVSWYRRIVVTPASFANKSITFKFIGVNYICDVWIDGHYIGYHEGGFTSFAFDVTPYMQPGRHVIAIRVDNPAWNTGIFKWTIIPDGCDYFNYGGIVRELYLEASPRINVARCDVRETDYTTSNHLNGSVQFQLDLVINHDGQHPACNVSVGLYPLSFPNQAALESRDTWLYANKSDGTIIVPNQVLSLTSTDGYNCTAHRFDISLPLVSYWSTKHPNLYAVLANVTADGITDQFCTQTGFRNFTTAGVDLLLNGAPLKLAGVSIHEQYPAPTGRSLNDDQRFLDLECVNATKSNWWRGSYPFHPMMYVYSDRFGIACWEESPLFWANEVNIIQGFARNAFPSIWVEMVYRDFNRPSILMWSAGNEPWAYDTYLQYLQQSKAFLDTHDPNRIMAFACVSSQSWTSFFRDTPLRVVTPNCYGGTFEGVLGAWYNETTANLKRYMDNNPGKPIVNMEFGYWRDGTSNQSRCFQECYKAFTENPNVQGFTWWLAFDYYGANYYNAMGVYNMARTWAQPDTFNAMVLAYTNYTHNNL